MVESHLVQSRAQVIVASLQHELDVAWRCALMKLPTAFLLEKEVVIVWETSCSKFQLMMRWGDNHSLLENMADGNEMTVIEIDMAHIVHKVILDRKKIGKVLYYQLYENLGYFESDVYKLKIPSENDTNQLIYLISDSQYGDIVFNQMLRNMISNKIKPSLVIHGGDTVEHYNKLKEWHNYFFTPLSLLNQKDQNNIINQIPIMLVRGNHEGESNYAYHYTISKPLWYTVTVSQIRFIVLDTNEYFPLQKEWLIKQLENNKLFKYNIVLCHIPPYIEYWERESWLKGDKDWNGLVREEYVPLFEKYNIDMVISGHSHLYQRGIKNGIYYLIIGGGGGNLETPEEKVENYNIYNTTKFIYHYLTMDLTNRLNFKVYDISNNLIESFSIDPYNQE